MKSFHVFRWALVALGVAACSGESDPLSVSDGDPELGLHAALPTYEVVHLPSLGGTLPLVVIERMLGSPVLTVPVVNADNNQHAENENVKVRFLWDGIETYAALLTMP